MIFLEKSFHSSSLKSPRPPQVRRGKIYEKCAQNRTKHGFRCGLLWRLQHKLKNAAEMIIYSKRDKTTPKTQTKQGGKICN